MTKVKKTRGFYAKFEPSTEHVPSTLKDIEFLLEHLKPLYPIAANKATNADGEEKEANREKFAKMLKERIPIASDIKIKAAIQKGFRPQ